MIDSVGFTGTQHGMTMPQRTVVGMLLDEYQPKHVHHGDCIGADEQFHALCKKLEPRPILHGHIPDDMSKRAFCDFDIEYAPQAYLKRNKAIVIMSDILIAAPKQGVEVVRSGTWSTVRYADGRNLSVRIVLPDGSVVAPTENAL